MPVGLHIEHVEPALDLLEPAVHQQQEAAVSAELAAAHILEQVGAPLEPLGDRLVRDNSFHIGGGVAYSLPRIDLFMSYVQFVGGVDTHAGRVITAGLSWPFELQ